MAVSSPRKSSRDSRVAPEAFYGDLDQLLKKGSPKPAFRQIIEWVRQIAEAHNILQRDHFKPGRVRVHKNGTDQAVATSPVTVTVTYSTKGIDTNGWFDLSTNRFIPKQRGTYFCLGRIGTKNGASTQAINNRLTKNGTVIAQGTIRISTAGGFACHPVWDVVEMNGDTDYVEHEFRNVTSGTIDIDGAETQTNFIAWRFL